MSVYDLRTCIGRSESTSKGNAVVDCQTMYKRITGSRLHLLRSALGHSQIQTLSLLVCWRNARCTRSAVKMPDYCHCTTYTVIRYVVVLWRDYGHRYVDADLLTGDFGRCATFTNDKEFCLLLGWTLGHGDG